MTTHDRDKIIAAAKDAGCSYADLLYDIAEKIEQIRAIAHEDGRQAERIVTIKDDDDLRFIKRVLEGNNPAEEDKEKCLHLIHEIRSRARSTK